MKKRTGDPWIPGDTYGRMLPAFMANLVVRDIERAIPFYRDVLAGVIHYADPDFAAIKVGGAELMLHADHTYDKNPWHQRLVSGERRGLGAELRLFGVNPDEVETRARRAGATIVRPATTRAHGWREVMVEDADGYVWAVGTPAEKP
jgi:uncharacterized glyoxalase superfamily protein PhnB